jgi:NAD(P)-dependent dehydrogenase (short-subunit alcohol dehydrogenase family)
MAKPAPHTRFLTVPGAASFGRFDILLNNAGNEPKPPETFTFAEWNGC